MCLQRKKINATHRSIPIKSRFLVLWGKLEIACPGLGDKGENKHNAGGKKYFELAGINIVGKKIVFGNA
jgi:hypothetical protein